MNFDVKGPSNKSTRDGTLIHFLKAPAIMAAGVSKTIFFSFGPNQLGDELKLLLQEKQADNNSHRIDEKIVAIVDKLFEDNCISKKKDKESLNKCNLLHSKKVTLCVYTQI